MYSFKEIFLTLQGEGGQAGRVNVFARFAGCNLWSGREQDRAAAACDFCDTDFVGTDGENGGKFATPADVVEAMERAPGGWDLLVAADVLVYIGDLAPVFAAAARALPPEGRFAATVERLPGEAASLTGGSFVLGATRRYAHAEHYVRATAEAAGFLIRLMEPCSPRREKGIPVPGLLFVVERAAR